LFVATAVHEVTCILVKRDGLEERKASKISQDVKLEIIRKFEHRT
jgi:hypothetical protein